MTFDPTIPAANDLLSQSQSDIQTNFTVSNNCFAIDHVAFNVGVDPGKHKQIYFNANNVPGAPAGNQSIIYTNGTPPVPYHRNSAFLSEMPRVWARLILNGNAVPAWPGNLVPAAGTSYNVARTERFAGDPAGAYTIVFATALPNTNYLVLVTGMSGGNAPIIGLSDVGGYRNTGFVQIKSYNPRTLSLQDNPDINILILGN